MTDIPGSTPPFPGFPGFPPAEMLDRMWDMMRLTPFGSAFPGAQAGAAQGLGPSLSMMSDMMAPLTSVEELDKRITDMRAVEQWLKLNLNMLQSAIQALEVQRATLATLRAFGAFAQQSMAQPATPPSAPAPQWPRSEPAAAARPGAEDKDEPETEAGESTPAFDASSWWNLLQSQFNQIAQFAMSQPGTAAASAESSAQAATDAPAASGAADPGAPTDPEDKLAAKEPAAKRAASARSSSGAASRPRASKKAPSQPE
ncbi:PhaM family polyhydroxyalkanoate granule multifunctional regulatory protein [Paraburkholderia sp.]|uniref:PhaM family polyhydroxyalkanoate granule multifunctional regulatory protein n=1 Tax=Paraburkholderia sp. TaxID=1926495 RepID=UPI002F3E610C